MKKILSFIFIIFLSISSFAQTDFKGDLIADKSTRASRILAIIDSSYTLEKNYEFEFRLWTLPSLTNYASVFILTQRQGKWGAKYFEYYGGKKESVTETKLDQSNVDSLWKRLVAHQVLTLPTQDSIRSKMRIFVADTSNALSEADLFKRVIITDGTIYRFELVNKNQQRTYEYHCPQGNLKHFPNVEELYRAFAIIVIIRKYIGLKLTVC